MNKQQERLPTLVEIREQVIDSCKVMPSKIECVTYYAKLAYGQQIFCKACAPRLPAWEDVTSHIDMDATISSVYMVDVATWKAKSYILIVRCDQCERCKAAYYALLRRKVPLCN